MTAGALAALGFTLGLLGACLGICWTVAAWAMRTPGSGRLFVALFGLYYLMRSM